MTVLCPQAVQDSLDRQQQQLRIITGGPLLFSTWQAYALCQYIYKILTDDQLLQKLYSIYKFDFLLFGYNFDDFLKQLQSAHEEKL